MAIKTSKGSQKGVFTEINITPLTDIFLVLLIIMMVIAPSFQSIDNNVTIPEINSGVAVESLNATVSVTKDNIMFINGKQVDETSLEGELLAIKDTLEKKEVLVRADEKAKSSQIMKIMQASQAAGYDKLVIAGEPLSKKDQKKLEKEADVPTQTDF